MAPCIAATNTRARSRANRRRIRRGATRRTTSIFFFLMMRRPPRSPLFPYPAPFRSRPDDAAVAVRLPAVRPDADPLGRALRPVADEDVGRAVGVARHEVGSVREEGDEVPVRRDRR